MNQVGVIGAGVMGEALIAALISYGTAPASITISEKRKDRADELRTRYGIKVEDVATNVSKADALLLVVKPQDMATVLDEIKGSINKSAVVITFAAGKKISFIEQGLGTGNPVVRVMPNTPTLVGAGMAAISLGAGVSADQSKFVSGFLAATGKVIEVSEDLQDAVTVLLISLDSLRRWLMALKPLVYLMRMQQLLQCKPLLAQQNCLMNQERVQQPCARMSQAQMEQLQQHWPLLNHINWEMLLPKL